MLVMDLASQAWLGRTMDENDAELVKLLYTRIGMIMEDASMVALELGGHIDGLDPGKIKELEGAVGTLSALAKSARLLGRR